MQKVCQTLV